MTPPTKSSVWKDFEECEPLREEAVYSMVGYMLFRLHAFEGLLRLCAAVLKETSINFSSGEEIDAVDRLREMRDMGINTLGQVAASIRKIVDLDPNFNQALRRLTKRRNAFAHKLSTHSPFNPLRGQAWHRNVPRFIRAMHHDLETVEYVFETYAKALIRQREGDPAFIFDEREVTQFLTFKTKLERK